ncbi:unnamed protein product [Medioppia subpectinata]|uniref:Uncharacterized protein n=1 Tax=Medioppia subpectinata TaxID=1979941 RepID=A0A7R9KDR8_9ACAR|nr:unnamed protein product [Medioppia subpectinata]CAG2100412.1 unnamed protein product [Medioppia subpectinata]
MKVGIHRAHARHSIGDGTGINTNTQCLYVASILALNYHNRRHNRPRVATDTHFPISVTVETTDWMDTTRSHLSSTTAAATPAIVAPSGSPTVTTTTASVSTAAQPVSVTLTTFTPHNRTDNPFSKTPVTGAVVVTPAVVPVITSTHQHSSSPPKSMSSSTATTGGDATADTAAAESTGRSSVILAPARLALNNNTNTTTGASISSATPLGGVGAGAAVAAPLQHMATNRDTINNYFSSNITAGGAAMTTTTTGSTTATTGGGSGGILAESRLSSAVLSTAVSTGTTSKSLLRPSVLRFADSSTNNSQNVPKESKVFAFVSLSKEDIPRPATTLLPADSIIRCGADTTSPFNGEEASAGGTTSTSNTTTSSTKSTHTSSSTANTYSSDGSVSLLPAPVVSVATAATAGSVAISSSSDVVVAAAAGAGSSSSGGTGSIDSCDDSNSQSAFVFGHNLAERAVYVQNSGQKHGIDGPDDTANGSKRTKTAAGDDSAAKHDINGDIATGGFSAGTEGKADGALDLSSTGAAEPSGSAASPDKHSDNKRKYEVITGEEVMRTSGALRVILNAHVVSGMRFDVSNEQCLRFTNVDGIYLIKGAPKDIDQLNSAVEYRLREIAKRSKQCDEHMNAETTAADKHKWADRPLPPVTPPPVDSQTLPSQPTPLEETSNDS